MCEGYTDVIGFFMAGLPRAVATCGTALGEEHFRLLRNFARRVVLAYDADAAGQAGAGRVYEWERHHEVDVAVAALPAGTDPGDLARTIPTRCARAVANANPFSPFAWTRCCAAADLRSVEGRARAAEAAVATVAEHPNELVRDQYLMQVADRCRFEPAVVRALAARIASVTAAPVRHRRERSRRADRARRTRREQRERPGRRRGSCPRRHGRRWPPERPGWGRRGLAAGARGPASGRPPPRGGG